MCWRAAQSVKDRWLMAGFHFQEFECLMRERFPGDRLLVDEQIDVFVPSNRARLHRPAAASCTATA
jgi:hypothetical protein